MKIDCHYNSLFNDNYTVESIKKIALNKSDDTLDFLIDLYNKDLEIDVKREVISSIGRQDNKDKIYIFIKSMVFEAHCMDLVYQMFRTCLYNQKEERFLNLSNEILTYFDNEILYKMQDFYNQRHLKKAKRIVEKQILSPSMLRGNNVETLKRIKEQQVNLIFTSPPYYNAREYSDYNSYSAYLKEMKKTLLECYRVLEDGRFIIINVSPVITKRPGREFESIRYPIHFDFHSILVESGFYFIDEIIWIKPEYSVPNRVGGYQQTRMPLSYKPNCITESLLIYRKKAPFLLDKNIKKYNKDLANLKEDSFEKTNCWYISPKSSKNHPAVFPEELCEKVLNYYSFKGDVVLDPFAGSGTLGRVAIAMDRIPLLCEKNFNYIKLLERDGYNDI